LCVFHLYHHAAHCTETRDEFGCPSMHANCLAFDYLSDGAPVYQVHINVLESCLSGLVCLCCFTSCLLKEVVFQVCTDFLGSYENSPPFAMEMYGCSISLCMVLGPVCLSGHIHINVPLLRDHEDLVFVILMSSDMLP